MSICAQSSQRATWPPRAAVRQLSIADITLIWPRLTWPGRMPAGEHGGTGPRGRRPKASSGRNRDGEWMAMPRALWGFGRSGARGGQSAKRLMAKLGSLRMGDGLVFEVCEVFPRIKG